MTVSLSTYLSVLFTLAVAGLWFIGAVLLWIAGLLELQQAPKPPERDTWVPTTPHNLPAAIGGRRR